MEPVEEELHKQPSEFSSRRAKFNSHDSVNHLKKLTFKNGILKE